MQYNAKQINNIYFKEKEMKSALKLKIEQTRSHRIKMFSDSLRIAKSLKISKNNFVVPAKPIFLKQDVTDGTESDYFNKDFPSWFLYGELALKEVLRTMKNRARDEVYNEGLLEVMRQKERENFWDPIQSKMVQGDRIRSILIHLQIEHDKLKKIQNSILDVKVAQISQPSIPPTRPIAPQKIKVVALATGVGLLIGLLLSYISHEKGIFSPFCNPVYLISMLESSILPSSVFNIWPDK